MKKYKEMNEIEKLAYRNARNIFNYEVGGWYNCILDGCMEYIPDTIEEAKEIIYDETMTCHSVGGGHFSYRPIHEIRFAGEEFVRECVEFLFKRDKDGDVAEIRAEKGWA